MAITRTIYTQGAVSISGYGLNNRFLSGVQSANISINTPREDVNQFNTLGAINKVQLESASATAEISCVISSGNAGVLPILVYMSKVHPTTYYNIDISGVGSLQSGLLSSFSIDTSVGNIPQLNMTFVGNSGNYIGGGDVPTTPNAITLNVSSPEDVVVLYSGDSVCAQSVRVNWEMPTQKYNCLGNALSEACIYTIPPGTASLTVDGTEYPALVTGFNVGIYSLDTSRTREISRTHNMAVGDASATYTLTQEANGIDLQILDSTNIPYIFIDINGRGYEMAGAVLNIGDSTVVSTFGPQYAQIGHYRMWGPTYIIAPDNESGVVLIEYGYVDQGGQFAQYFPDGWESLNPPLLQTQEITFVSGGTREFDISYVFTIPPFVDSAVRFTHISGGTFGVSIESWAAP